MTTVQSLAHAERAEFADLLDGLTSQQWSAPSLCDGWSVQNVVAHTIAYLQQSRTRLLSNMIRSRWNIDQLNARGLHDYADVAPEQLIKLMREGVEPAGAGALYGGRVALIECLIHQQDIRRPLGKLRTIPEERLRVSLNYARISPVIAGARRTRGLRLVATNMTWSAGRGPEVRGSAESLLMAMTGRAAKVSGDLSGDGMALLL
jgi:uncharacterized protein (TIGR03083 family)